MVKIHEYKFIRIIGGDAVGMSTVPEMMKAEELGLEVIGISCLTNYGTGLSDSILYHKLPRLNFHICL